MAVRWLERGNRAQLREFVELEPTFIREDRLFVSEPHAAVIDKLSPQSPFYDDADVALLVADDGERAVARCAPIINRRWQDSPRDPGVVDDASHVGFIGYFAAAANSARPVREMLQAAERWLRDRGIRRVIAPCNGNVLAGAGLLTDAFLESPVFPMPWNPSYYVGYLHRAGYAPRYPIWFFDVEFSSEVYRRFSEKALAIRTCEVRTVDRGDWENEVDILRDLHNRGFQGEWELQHFTKAEFDAFYAWMKDALPDDFLLFAYHDGEPVGFAFGYPDWTPKVRARRGKAPTKSTFGHGPDDFARACVIGGAMLPEHQERRVGTKLAGEFFHRMEEKYKLAGAVYGYVNHANFRSRGLAESAGGKGRILYHCFDKTIADRDGNPVTAS